MSIQKLEREVAFQPLSRDHGVLLVLVQRLRKAAVSTEHDRAYLVRELRSHHATLVEQYLADEQAALGKANIGDLLAAEIADEHAQINRGIKRLTASSIGSLQAKDFDALAKAIEKHVRWDEREVMPYLQRTMSAGEREALVLNTAQVESSRDRPTQKLHHSINLDKSSGRAETCSCADCLR
jgi:hypothetical protein